jgi:hypothetical protein
MCDQAGHGFLSFPNTYKGIIFFKSDVKALSSWYEELKVANSAFHNVGWQRQPFNIIAHNCRLR